MKFRKDPWGRIGIVALCGAAVAAVPLVVAVCLSAIAVVTPTTIDQRAMLAEATGWSTIAFASFALVLVVSAAMSPALKDEHRR